MAFLSQVVLMMNRISIKTLPTHFFPCQPSIPPRGHESAFIVCATPLWHCSGHVFISDNVTSVGWAVPLHTVQSLPQLCDCSVLLGFTLQTAKLQSCTLIPDFILERFLILMYKCVSSMRKYKYDYCNYRGCRCRVLWSLCCFHPDSIKFWEKLLTCRVWLFKKFVTWHLSLGPSSNINHSLFVQHGIVWNTAETIGRVQWAMFCLVMF